MVSPVRHYNFVYASYRGVRMTHEFVLILRPWQTYRYYSDVSLNKRHLITVVSAICIIIYILSTPNSSRASAFCCTAFFRARPGLDYCNRFNSAQNSFYLIKQSDFVIYFFAPIIHSRSFSFFFSFFYY
jgi:hypothetical protein